MDSTLTDIDYITRLFDRINYERQPRVAAGEFKLTNMIHLLEQLGNPQLDCPVIHVAGTKGKGSVCAFIGSILQSAGFTTGIYSSPHLERVNQRISLAGQQIEDEKLAEVLRTLEPVITAMDAIANDREAKKLTFFEVITACAFQYFSQRRADAVVLEVGMGGRLDSTNVCHPAVCVVTNISRDHTRQLGSTLEKIAAEKAGIIKQRVPVICGVTNEIPLAVIQDFAQQHHCQIQVLNTDFRVVESRSRDRKFDFHCIRAGQPSIIKHLHSGMRGVHQHENAAIAIAVCEQLRSDGWEITDENVLTGISQARLPGRCEVFPAQFEPESARPLIVLDMAHNEASTAALAATLKTDIPEFVAGNQKTLLFATSREKDVAALLKPLLGLFDRIVITKYQDNPRGRAAAEIAEVAKDLIRQTGSRIELTTTLTPAQAYQSIRNESSPADAFCITGSAFLVAELRPLIV